MHRVTFRSLIHLNSISSLERFLHWLSVYLRIVLGGFLDKLEMSLLGVKYLKYLDVIQHLITVRLSAEQ